jgi:ABC-type uncharacterized transport system YnjBCD ATPase subunit
MMLRKSSSVERLFVRAAPPRVYEQLTAFRETSFNVAAERGSNALGKGQKARASLLRLLLYQQAAKRYSPFIIAGCFR